MLVKPEEIEMFANWSLDDLRHRIFHINLHDSKFKDKFYEAYLNKTNTNIIDIGRYQYGKILISESTNFHTIYFKTFICNHKKSERILFIAQFSMDNLNLPVQSIGCFNVSHLYENLHLHKREIKIDEKHLYFLVAGFDTGELKQKSKNYVLSSHLKIININSFVRLKISN